MPRVKLSPELKKAISDLPDREKDKLLHRLIALKPDLVEQLIFRLLEDSETTDERRHDVRHLIESTLENYREHYHSPGYLLLEMRALSGEINRHLRTTKDKYGEVALNLLLLNRTFELFTNNLRRARPRMARTFNDYVVKRALKLIGLVEKLHEDYRLDFQEDFVKLAQHLRQLSGIRDTARRLGLELDVLAQAANS